MTVALVPGVYAVPHTQLHYSSCYRSWNLHHLYLVVVVLYNKTSKFLFHFGSVKSLEMTAGYWQGISPGLGLVGDLRFLWFICSSPLTLSWPAASSFITRSTRVFYCLRTAKLHNLTLNKKKPNLQSSMVTDENVCVPQLIQWVIFSHFLTTSYSTGR